MRPRPHRALRRVPRFPRVSGDAPQIQAIPEIGKTFSPRERGCAAILTARQWADVVFPA